jgi:hypothetical protein
MRHLTIAALVFCLAGCVGSSKRFEPANLFAGTDPKAYLSAHVYGRLVIEVLGVEGVPIDLGALGALTDAAKMLCNKPAGVELVQSPLVPRWAHGAQRWTNAQLGAFCDRYSKHRTSANTVVLHLIFVPGNHADGAEVGAVTFAKDKIGVFAEVDQSRVMSSVLVHEFGHICGLVNNGTPDTHKHEDSDSSGHCKNTACTMFWVSSGITAFCQDCLADLRR